MEKHDKKLIERIAIEVQTEYIMGGLAEGIYLDFATEVAMRYADSKQAVNDNISDVVSHIFRSPPFKN
jgi:hypothetical protein